MKKFTVLIFIFLLLPLFKIHAQDINSDKKIRGQADTVGFASNSYEMDEFMKRIYELQNKEMQKVLTDADVSVTTVWKAAICPHDDYTYAGYLYPALLSNIKAKTIILIGVCHKAKLFGLEDKIIFDNYSNWQMPYGNVPVSKLRKEIMKILPEDEYLVHDSVQQAEHSVEAIIPFLQYYNREIEIISILVPYMPFDKMNNIAGSLGTAIYNVMNTAEMRWGKDFSIIISNDAVHYGDKDWGGSNFAFYGSDSSGYKLAVEHEMEIINNCLTGSINFDKINKFFRYTIKEDNYKDYKWTWCGRYSVPFGLFTLSKLETLFGQSLSGVLVKYATSIDYTHIPVEDIGMGITAPAHLNHWVGYAAIGYR